MTDYAPLPTQLPAAACPARPVKPDTLLIAAAGRNSLLPGQAAALEKAAHVRYAANLVPFKPDDFIDLARGHTYLAITRRAIDRLDRAVIDALPGLCGLSVYSTGLEWIDRNYLLRRGIRLRRLPAYCTNAVAEVALGLVLMLSHKLHLRYLKTLGAVPPNVSLRGRELGRRTVGILGYGRIGQALAEKLRPLCGRVVVHDCRPQRYQRCGRGVEALDKFGLLRVSDCVVVCASQDFSETPILTTAELARLRPGALLINVGRTSLVDTLAANEAVRAGHLSAYVYDDLLRHTEAPGQTGYGTVVPTGHTAWYTDEAMAAGTNAWIHNLIRLCETHKTL